MTPAARLEMLHDLYAPMGEDGERDPSAGVISREQFLALLEAFAPEQRSASAHGDELWRLVEQVRAIFVEHYPDGTKTGEYERRRSAMAALVRYAAEQRTSEAQAEPCEGHEREAEKCIRDGCAKCCACGRPLRTADAQPLITDTPYDHAGTPGRQCSHCGTAWPAIEEDAAPWHHNVGCPALRRTEASPPMPGELVVGDEVTVTGRDVLRDFRMKSGIVVEVALHEVRVWLKTADRSAWFYKAEVARNTPGRRRPDTSPAAALRDGLNGLLDAIAECHDGRCPGVCAADHLDAIYEAAEIARHTPGLGRAAATPQEGK